MMAELKDDTDYMTMALAEAARAAQLDEVPVGAVIVKDNQVIARAHNLVETKGEATAHAELLAIRAAMAAIGNKRLTGCALYVTLEPCTMCAGAISLARISRVIVAARDPKGGAVWHGSRFFDQPTCHHRPALADASPAQVDAAGTLLREFFQSKRGRARDAAAMMPGADA